MFYIWLCWQLDMCIYNCEYTWAYRQIWDNGNWLDFTICEICDAC